MKLRTDLIRTDGGTQMRVGPYNEDVLKDYQEVVKEGGTLPALAVFQEDSTLWLADGFHRLKAYKNLSIREVEADVREGTKRDAILFAVGANASHGLRRTNADKRRAVETLLKDQEWGGWVDAEIARRANVSAMTVGRLRKELISNNVIDAPTERTVQRGGATFTQQTGNIGKRPAEAEALAQEAQEQATPPLLERQPVVDTVAPQQLTPARPDTEFGLIIGAPPVPVARPVIDLPDGYRPGADPNIPPRLDALRKILDTLLKFDKDGPELLEHRGSDLMQLKLLAYYAHEMLGKWLHGEPAQPERTITVEALN